MGKNPAFQFYPSDWIRDPQLRQASFQARGIWIDCLCYMWWAEKKGELSGTIEGLSRLLGCTIQEFEGFIEEVKTLKFADCVIRNDKVTLKNRRMIKDEKARESNRLRQQRFKDKRVDNDSITDVKQDPPPLPGEGDGIEDGSLGTKVFKRPSILEIISYCEERVNNIDPQYFYDFQEARGWILSNGRKMRDWKATIRTWEKNDANKSKSGYQGHYSHLAPGAD